METVVCNLCGSAENEALYEMRDWSFISRDILVRFVRCKQCGLVYQNPRPGLDEIGAYYPDEYDCYTVDQRENFRKNWIARTSFAYGMRRRISQVTRFCKGGRLLDIGCATGNFLEAFARQPGWSVEGLEISPFASDIAHQKGLSVFTGRLREAGYSSASFDAVTLWDVLEHLHDPCGDLAEISRILKPGGLLVFRVPNLDSWDANLFKQYWAGFEPPRHLYVFSRHTLAKLLRKTGFTVCSMDTKASRHMTFMLSLQFRLTDSGAAPTARAGWIRLLNHPVARLLLAPFFFVYGAGMRGPLLSVVSQKMPVASRSQ